MGYRKFKADLLFTGLSMLDDGSVLITDSSGKVEEIIAAELAGDEIEIFNGILSPGFINAHCHVELSHMKRAIPEGIGLVDFLIKVIKERSLPQEIIEDAIQKAVGELYETGTVAVADICNTTHSLAAKNSSSLSWHNFIEVIGFTNKPEDRFAFASKLLREFEINGESMDKRLLPTIFSSSITPHAPYSVSGELFALINNASGSITTIHNQEAEAENNLYMNKSGKMLQLYEALNINPAFFQPSGKSSLQTYLPFLNHSSNILLVHNTYTSPEDLQFVKYLSAQTAQQFFFVSCINANLYIESRVSPILLLKESGCTICLGTDSYASNHSLNILDEMKTVQFHFPSISLQEMLTWSTLNGATALKLDSIFGSFEKGKHPGIVHINNIKDGRLSSNSVSRRLL
jgi:aminodeoxyfutalosine deaminase